MSANRFLRYVRMGFKSAIADAITIISVIFQGQG
ncbi:MAG: DUF6385 domain-containing protein [Ruminiclostridium sp.]